MKRFFILFLYFSFSSHQNYSNAAPTSSVSTCGRPSAADLLQNRDALITALKSLNVTIDHDNPQLFDKDFLLYLYSYFATTRPAGPIHLNATPKTGSLRTWASDRSKAEGGGINLFFTKDANRDILNKQLANAKTFLAQHPDVLKKPGTLKITVDFSNTLFEQLSRAVLTQNQLEGILLSKYHLDVKPPKDSKTYKEFSQSELVTLLKQLKDIPEGLVQKMKLRSLLRVKGGLGIPGDPNAAANYTPSTQQIKITDNIFDRPGDSLGEGSFLHEIGHAVWASLSKNEQKEYENFSWSSSKLKPNVKNFVSEYAMSKPTEDFAEHFSAYVNQPELMTSKAGDKKAWLEKEVFKNTVYYSTASANAQIYIDSKCPDTHPPAFTGNLSDNVHAVCKAVNENEAELIIDVKNLKDDISGVKEMYISFDNPNDWQSCGAFLRSGQCVDPKTGHYRYSEIIQRSEYKAGTYSAKDIGLTDRAGNEIFISSAGVKPIYIPGTKNEPKPSEKITAPDFFKNSNAFKSVSIVESKSNPSSYEISLPIHRKDLKNLNDLEVWFRSSPDGREFAYTPTPEELVETDGTVKFKMDFSRLPAGTISVDRVNITYHKNGDYPTFSVSCPRLPNTTFVFAGGAHVDKTTPNVLVNDVTVTAKSGRNSEGGDETVYVKVPVEGVDQGSEIAWVTLQTPSGKEIEGQFEINPSSHSTITVPIKLLPNHEKGVYLIKEIHVQEKLTGSSGLFVNNWHDVTAKLLERGIKKTVTITNTRLPASPETPATSLQNP